MSFKVLLLPICKIYKLRVASLNAIKLSRRNIPVQRENIGLLDKQDSKHWTTVLTVYSGRTW